MKENVKVDADLLEKVRKESKKRGQTFSGFIELATKQSLRPQYSILDNSDAFRKYLDANGVKYKESEHWTILLDIVDPIAFGMEWGMYKLQNAPQYKKLREHMADMESINPHKVK